MVKLDVITTRGGDAGETSLGDGARVRKDTVRIEVIGTVDEANAPIPPLRSFVLPGGKAGAAHAHLARTVVRRAERLAVALAGEEALNAAVLRYLNRLSDHLFVMARRLNDSGATDIPWKPGATR